MAEAPWTPAQVLKIMEWQTSNEHHPYTCPNRDAGHRDHGEGDIGVLYPLASGLFCRDCGYIQTRIHDMTIQ